MFPHTKFLQNRISRFRAFWVLLLNYKDIFLISFFSDFGLFTRFVKIKTKSLLDNGYMRNSCETTIKKTNLLNERCTYINRGPWGSLHGGCTLGVVGGEDLTIQSNDILVLFPGLLLYYAMYHVNR